MDVNDIKEVLERKPQLKCKIFARGFLLTDASVDAGEYPFYGLWKKQSICEYTLLVAPDQNIYLAENERRTIAIVGHAYHPFTLEYKEEDILNALLQKAEQGEKAFFEYFNGLTGIFTCFIVNEKQNLFVIGDPTCMQTTFYCRYRDSLYISSHTNCIGDLLGLTWDPYVRRLVDYKFFSLLGNSLPGDLTQFSEVKRLVPNHIACFLKNGMIQNRRFYWPERLRMDQKAIAKQASEILRSNMKLITEKWEKPAISMTGGCDSKTTLACTKGVYDKFSYFSYTSSDSEDVDANAAHEICGALNLPHEIHHISNSDEDYSLVEESRAVMFWNTGGILPINRNDVRKRCYYAEKTNFDVEVKSWASEIGRAYYSKRFNERKKFGEFPTPRKCTTMYKFFLYDRKLVRETDRVFHTYLTNFFERAKKNPVEWQEQLFWEFRVSSWNGLVITGEHRFSFDITIPYNNRRLLELLLSAPIEDRISDAVYSQIRSMCEPLIDQTGIAVTNLKHTKLREKMENMYYTLHAHVPF